MKALQAEDEMVRLIATGALEKIRSKKQH